MISFDAGEHQFNLRAAAIIIHDDQVLLHRIEGDPFWSVPGGRIEEGERAVDAIVRELWEELSETVVCERFLWVIENFFVYRQRKHHEIGLYFLAKLLPGSRLLQSGPFEGSEPTPKLTFNWFALPDLPGLDTRPSSLARALAVSNLACQHYVHYEQDGV